MTTSGPERVSDAILARLTRLHPKIIDLSLGRVERLLARLGHPERRLPPVIHVAGTNGKGSTLAFLRAILEAEGLAVHAYTSPHLVRFQERIRCAGRLIPEEELLALLEACEAANGEEPITFFEITTAAALLAFAEAPADLLLLEVGLGGRLDATNVVERPLVSAISPVSLDHQQYLGEDLAGIAFEKAGILKPGVPAAIGPQPAVALAAIEARAEAIGTPLTRFGREWRVEAGNGTWRYEGPTGSFQGLPWPVLPGRHQLDNAGLALAVLEAGGLLRAPERSIPRGLAAVEWPGRLQRLEAHPLSALLPPGWPLWLDGGHNPAAGQALSDFMATRPERPWHVVYGMLETKDAASFLAPVASRARSLTAIAIPGEAASLSAEAAAARGRASGAEVIAASGLEAALSALPREAEAQVLICGSLYLAGQVLALGPSAEPAR